MKSRACETIASTGNSISGPITKAKAIRGWSGNAVTAIAIVSVIVCALACIIFALASGLVVSIIMMFIFTLASNATFVTLFSWPHKLIRQEIIGSSIAIINIGSTFGGFLSPIITGYLITAFGGNYNIAFIAMGISAIICGVIVLLVRTKPVSTREHPFT